MNTHQKHKHHRRSLPWKSLGQGLKFVVGAAWLASVIATVVATPYMYFHLKGDRTAKLTAAVMEGKTSIADVPGSIAFYSVGAAVAAFVLVGAMMGLRRLRGDSGHNDPAEPMAFTSFIAVILMALVMFCVTDSGEVNIKDVDDERTESMMEQVGVSGNTERVVVTRKNLLKWSRLTGIAPGSCDFLIPDVEDKAKLDYSIRVCRAKADASACESRKSDRGRFTVKVCKGTARLYTFARSASDNPLPDKPMTVKAGSVETAKKAKAA